MEQLTQAVVALCSNGKLVTGCGTVFEFVNNSGAWSEQMLYSFSQTDGAHPEAGLIMDSQGDLYGTTAEGGLFTNSTGLIFELVKNSGYSFQPLHYFSSIPDGANPVAPLVQNASGIMFGTTQFGGTDNVGTVYQLAVAPIGTVPTNTSLTYAPNPPIAGAPVEFTATVTAPSLPGLVIDGGYVSFYSGTMLLGESAVLNGVVTLSGDAEKRENIGDGTVTAQYATTLSGGRPTPSIFTSSSGQISVLFAEPGVATTMGSNAFNGNQTVKGTVYATGFTSNGAGLTNVTAASLNCMACVGNPQLGISYARSASQGGPATSALSAVQASNALLFDELPATAFATLTTANTFTAAQTMPSLSVTGATQAGSVTSSSVTTGSITVGGGTALAEVVSVISTASRDCSYLASARHRKNVEHIADARAT